MFLIISVLFRSLHWRSFELTKFHIMRRCLLVKNPTLVQRNRRISAAIPHFLPHWRLHD